MSSTTTVGKPARNISTAADLNRQFGPIPFERVRFTRRTASMHLDGGDVLPGFSVQVGDLFEMPKRPASKGEHKKNGPQPGKKNGPRRSR